MLREKFSNTHMTVFSSSSVCFAMASRRAFSAVLRPLLLPTSRFRTFLLSSTKAGLHWLTSTSRNDRSHSIQEGRKFTANRRLTSRSFQIIFLFFDCRQKLRYLALELNLCILAAHGHLIRVLEWKTSRNGCELLLVLLQLQGSMHQATTWLQLLQNWWMDL